MKEYSKSPQLIAVKGGVTVGYASHGAINSMDLEQLL